MLFARRRVKEDADLRLWDASTGAAIGKPLRHEDVILGSVNGAGLHIRQNSGALLRWLRRWGKGVRRVGRTLNAVPLAMRIAAIAATVLAVFSAANIVYHVARKPTQILSPISSVFNKTPLETWRHYAPLFRQYSTAAITPELLAALAQVESMGNPLASTYWRWRLT